MESCVTHCSASQRDWRLFYPALSAPLPAPSFIYSFICNELICMFQWICINPFCKHFSGTQDVLGPGNTGPGEGDRFEGGETEGGWPSPTICPNQVLSEGGGWWVGAFLQALKAHFLSWGGLSSVQLLSHVQFFVTPWTTAHQASLCITSCQSWLKLMSIESVMPSNLLVLCRPLLLPSIFPSIRVFPNESVLCIRWPKYGSISFNISPSNEHPGLISFRMDWLDLLAVQGTLKSSPTPQFKSINSSVLSFLHGPTCTSIHYYWKNHSLD